MNNITIANVLIICRSEKNSYVFPLRNELCICWNRQKIVARNLCGDSMMLPRAHVCCKSLGKSKGGKSIRSRTVLTNFVTIEDISTFIKNESVTKSDEHAYPRSNCVNNSQTF